MRRRDPDASEAQCALTGVAPGQYGHILAVSASPVLATIRLLAATSTCNRKSRPLAPSAWCLSRGSCGLQCDLDWWDISWMAPSLKSAPRRLSITALQPGDPIFCSRIHRDPNGSLWLGNGYVDDRQANIGRLRVRGIDIVADYSAPLGPRGLSKLRIPRQLRSQVDHPQGGFQRRTIAWAFSAIRAASNRGGSTRSRVTWDTPSSFSVAWLAAHERREARRTRSEVQPD